MMNYREGASCSIRLYKVQRTVTLVNNNDIQTIKIIHQNINLIKIRNSDSFKS